MAQPLFVRLVLWLMILKWGTGNGELARLGFVPIFNFLFDPRARSPLLLFWAILRYQGEITSRMIKGAARNTSYNSMIFGFGIHLILVN